MKKRNAVDLAKRIYADPSDDDIEVDDDAEVRNVGGGIWVQAWVWVPSYEESDDDDG